MMIEDQLRERLKKVEALYFGSTSTGKREADFIALFEQKLRKIGAILPGNASHKRALGQFISSMPNEISNARG